MKRYVIVTEAPGPDNQVPRPKFFAEYDSLREAQRDRTRIRRASPATTAAIYKRIGR